MCIKLKFLNENCIKVRKGERSKDFYFTNKKKYDHSFQKLVKKQNVQFLRVEEHRKNV